MVSSMDVKLCLLRVATSGQVGYNGCLRTRLPTSFLGQALVKKQTTSGAVNLNILEGMLEQTGYRVGSL